MRAFRLVRRRALEKLRERREKLIADAVEQGMPENASALVEPLERRDELSDDRIAMARRYRRHKAGRRRIVRASDYFRCCGVGR